MSLSVLIVEDSRTQLIRIRADLEAQGFRVLAAEDGNEALAVARRERPDVILSDILMPGVDGFRLCREVQMDHSLRDIPVVLRTAAFLSDEDREFALKVGARGYIDKETDGTELGVLLTRVVTERTNHQDRFVPPDEFHEPYEERLLTRLVEEAARLEKVNEELRESRAQLQAIHDHSPIFIYVKDLDGRYLLTNAHFSVLGLDPQAAVGRTDAEIFGVDHAAALMANDRRVVEERRGFHVEEVVPADDGRHTVLSAKFPLFDPQGEVSAVSGVSIDITERSRMEQRLRQAERMEALGRLAGGVAHDFNNLLTIIANCAAFVADDLGDHDPRREDLEQVQDAAARGAKLIRQLLSFGGRKEIGEAEILDVNAAIREIESLLRVATGSRIELTLDLVMDVPPVRIDRTKIDQIMLNLVANARDAMPDGGKLAITTTSSSLETPTSIGDSELPAGSYVVLTVSDTGTGMSDEMLRKVFEPFFTTKEADKGTGLGLATIHGIVRSVGGAIDVRSEIGRGTAFSIWFPAGTERRSAETSERHSRSRPVGSTPRILAVDDDAGIRRVVRRTLERAGYEILVAASGREALEMYEQADRVDLLLSDIRMPGGMSGIELAQRLRALDPSLRVIHITGSEMSTGSEVLLKPFTAEALIARVEEALVNERRAG